MSDFDDICSSLCRTFKCAWLHSKPAARRGRKASDLWMTDSGVAGGIAEGAPSSISEVIVMPPPRPSIGKPRYEHALDNTHGSFSPDLGGHGLRTGALRMRNVEHEQHGGHHRCSSSSSRRVRPTDVRRSYLLGRSG